MKLSSSVAAELERAILAGDYAVGDRLPSERVLSEHLGVGRSSMREALRLLEADGYVRIEHGIGVTVVGATKRGPSGLLVVDGYSTPELFEVRRMFEPPAASLAAQRRSEEDVAQLQRVVAEQGREGLSGEEFVELDRQFHRAVVTASKNSLLFHLFETAEPLFVAYSRKVVDLPGRRVVAHTGHLGVAQAIADGRARDARSAMSQHLTEVERDIVDSLHATDA